VNIHGQDILETFEQCPDQKKSWASIPQWATVKCCNLEVNEVVVEERILRTANC
jgi:hypothetical protein